MSRKKKLGILAIIGGTVLVAGGAAVAVNCVKKEKEKEKEAPEAKVEDKEEDKEEDGSVFKRIKRFVKKRFVKFLTWVCIHMDKIEAVSAVIGLASGAIGIAKAVKEFRQVDETEEKLKRIEDEINFLNASYNADVVGVTDWLYHNFDALNRNMLKGFHQLGANFENVEGAA